MKIIVVVSQSGGSFERRDFEEKLIASLVMETEGIEVTVVPQMEELEPETTGLLCLEGIKGDMIFVSWEAPARAHQELGERGVFGRFGKTIQQATPPSETHLPLADDGKLPPGVYDAMKRRIYCLDLNGFSSVDDLRKEVERIADENTVQTVEVLDLGLGTNGAVSPSLEHPSPSGSEPASEEGGQSSDSNSTSSPPSLDKQSTSKPKAADAPRRPHVRDALMEEVECDGDEQELDRLLDQFDQLDEMDI